MTSLRGLGLAAILCFGAPALASDSSSDSPGGFTAKVQAASGVVLKVPIDQQGRELSTATELRLHNGPTVTGAGIKAAFDAGVESSQVPKVNAQDIASDSSTWGWYDSSYYGYNSYGWCPSYYYYNNYSPYYYYSGSYYNYYSPSYYNYYYPSSYYYGYRYYYYPRYYGYY